MLELIINTSLGSFAIEWQVFHLVLKRHIKNTLNVTAMVPSSAFGFINIMKAHAEHAVPFMIFEA